MQTNCYIPKADIDKVANVIIEHIGKKSPITAKSICNIVGFETKANTLYCRQVLNEVSRTYDLPIIASHKGFYIAETHEEVQEYISFLDTTIKGMEERKAMILEIFKR